MATTTQATSTYSLDESAVAFVKPTNGYIAIPVLMGATALLQASLALLSLGHFLV
jgi:hypothetical protein